MKNKFWIIFGVFYLVIVFVGAAPILDELHLNIQTTDGSGNVVTGTYSFVFNISTTADCANVVYSNSTSLTTDSRGIISYYLQNTNLDYQNQYYLCYYRDGSLIETSKIARTPYSFSSRNATISGIIVDSNLNLGGYNATASWFNGLFNWTTSDLYNIFNGSSLSFNESKLNQTIESFGYLTQNLGTSTYVPYTGSSKNVVLGNYNFSVGTSDFFVNANTGNVGIGTANPTDLLHIKGNNPIIRLSNSGAGGVESFIQNVYSGGNNFLRFYEGNYGFSLFNNTGISVGSYVSTLPPVGGAIISGNVGIGTTSPGSYKLSVNGDSFFNGTFYIKTTSITVEDGGNVNVW